MSGKVPRFLAGRLAALVLTLGAGGGAYLAADQAAIEQGLADRYVQAVAADPDTSQGVKVAMVLGHFYESSGKHIGTPYIDKLGKGAPLTVCNGITGAGVIAGKRYSPGECYQLEKGRYLQSERTAERLLAYWASYDAFAQGTFIDFLHNKGAVSFSTSTMRRKANAGDLQGACRENPRWNKGTVKGVSTVLPGLQLRGNSNDEICREWRMGGQG
ncbi:Lysozyme [Comamonas aquatilis]|uniref:glycoside hydrolase family protein n=1 Tax=Comamonas aquatilis TaxID=1778406 RepID=UPI0039EF2A60